MDEALPEVRTQGTWDPFIEELQGLRKTAGNPSFQRITDLIIERRVSAGASPAAAHLNRSTVYDTFRVGRPRVNLDLAREAALALGATDETVGNWMASCQSPSVEDTSPGWGWSLLLMVGCFVMNMVGRELVDTLHLPIYLDMTGTALAAITLGPWRGAAVGLSTSLIGALTSGWVSIPFGLVEVAGALVWGYGVKRFDMGKTLARFFALSLIVAVACSAFAVPIIIALAGQSFKDAHGMVVDLMKQTFPNEWVAAVAANLFTSLIDKFISTFVALVGLSMLPLAFRRGSQVLLADPEVKLH